MAYCTINDLLIGSLPISELVDKETFVDDAADEIDAALGEIYVVPITGSPLSHHAEVLLKKINSHLATGRLITVLAIGAEDTSVQAYGLMLINEAMALLMRIAAGQIKLTGATTQEPDHGNDTGPGIRNRDQYSSVESFEDAFMRPYVGGVPLPAPIWAPGESQSA